MNTRAATIALGAVPESLRSQVTRWWDRACGLPVLLAACQALPHPLRKELARAIGASEFIASALLQDPEALAWLDRNDDPSVASAAGTEYQRRASAAATTADAQRILREWRRREMVRIAWRDIAGRASVTDTMRAVSDLADACIRAGVAAAQRHLETPFGRPRTAAAPGNAGAGDVPFIAVAMGKLGGRELNFSSDVDLVFLYAEAGETDGLRPIDNSEYFNRLGRELIRLLDARTEDGFVFRVDTRLRPFGDSGPLAVSLASLENYLQEHGRDWERYAWIKARAVVGADIYARATRDFIRPFVYRRYLDFGVFDSLQRVVSDVTSSQGSTGVNAKAWFSASRVLGYTALLGSLNIVLITAMSTIGAVVYNLTSRLVGGVEVTLKETE